MFVARAQPLTGWQVKVGRGSRQNPRSRWNYWARLLCPSCAGAVAAPPSWVRVPVATVRRRRGPSVVQTPLG